MTPETKLSVLVVGAGAVGQVIAHHLLAGGACSRVAFLVHRPEYAAHLASHSLEIHRLTTSKSKRPIVAHASGFGVYSSALDAARVPFDVVLLTLSSDAMRLLDWAALCQTRARAFVFQQLVLGDLEFVQSKLVGGDSSTSVFLMSLSSLLAWQVPLPGERFPATHLLQGTGDAIGRVKIGSPVAFITVGPIGLATTSTAEIGGNSLRLLAQLQHALSAGNLRCKLVKSVPALDAWRLGFIHPLLCALQTHGWQFEALRKDTVALGLTAKGIRESIRVTCAQAGIRPTGVWLLSAHVLSLFLRLSPKALSSFDFEAYLKNHFRGKVADQMDLVAESYVAYGELHGIDVLTLRYLHVSAGTSRLLETVG